jgi:hypothetical protein
MVKVFVSNMIQMALFESLRKYIGELNIDPPPPKAKIGWNSPLYGDKR